LEGLHNWDPAIQYHLIEYANQPLTIVEITTPPLKTYHLDLEGALPYFCLLSALVVAVGGWFWLFFVR